MSAENNNSLILKPFSLVCNLLFFIYYVLEIHKQYLHAAIKFTSYLNSAYKNILLLEYPNFKYCISLNQMYFVWKYVIKVILMCIGIYKRGGLFKLHAIIHATYNLDL